MLYKQDSGGLHNISVLEKNETTMPVSTAKHLPYIPPSRVRLFTTTMRRSPRHFLTIVGTAAFIVAAIIGLIGFVSAVSSMLHLILGTCGIKFILLVLLT